MKEYGYWLYSAMTQATAALFGVIGMFIIYKLQSLRDGIKIGERGILDALQRIGLSYTALERKTFEEIEKILIDEIKRKEDYLKSPYGSDVDQRQKKDKYEKELFILRGKQGDLKSARSKFDSLVKNGKHVITGLGFIFVFSIALLIGNPLLAQARKGFILLLVVYMVSLVLVFAYTFKSMKNTLTL